MNANEYINSGILQDYCLGLLTDDEKKNVDAMCQAYPEVAKELQLLHLALEQYADGNKKWRRNELRSIVLESLKKLWKDSPLNGTRF
jgi:hypothetical protein